MFNRLDTKGLLVIVLLFIIYLCVDSIKSNRYWKQRNVSFEKPKLIFGNLLDVILGKNSLGKYIANLYKKFDTPYFGIFMLNKPVLVVKDPNLLKHIFVKDFRFFTDKNFYTNEKIDPIFSKSIISASFKTWKPLRSQLTRAFTSGKIKEMLKFKTKSAVSLVDYLKTRINNDFIAYDVIGNFIADATAACLYGIDLKCFSEKNLIKYHSYRLIPRSGYETIKLYSYNFVHTAVRLFRFKFFHKESTKYLNKVFSDLIEERKLENVEQNDFINLLLNIKDSENFKVSDEVLVSQAITFLAVSEDTTNLTTSFAMYELCKNLDIQDRLRTEINDVLQHYKHVSYKAINEMKYLDMIVSETLRKYPVASFLQRKCVADYTVPGTDLKLERNTNIMIPIHGLHFDPKYFPDPERFDPDRFNNVNKHKIHPYAYLPFGMGPRNCIGRRFALILIKVALVYMIKNYKFKESDQNEYDLVFKTSYVMYSANRFKISCQIVNNK